MRGATAITALAALALWCGEPAAQPGQFIDPTRPPNAIPEGGATTAGEPRLQSVLIAPERRRAIIDGRTVRVGDKVGDSTVVRIAVGEVVLRRGADSRALKLLPYIEKVRSPRSPARRGIGKEGSE